MITYLLFVILLYFIFSVFLPLALSLSYKLSKEKDLMSSLDNSKIAVFIPAYKEDAVIEKTVKNTLLQNYPRDRYEVIVIADQINEQVIYSLKKLKINVFEVSFLKSTKAKALNAAFNRIGDCGFELALIVDADNHLDKNFLNIINAHYQNGSIAMQGRREAKNISEATAFLDGISEIANTNIFGKGAENLGLSARLAGSGMAFRYDLLRRLMKEATAIGGFDKEMELKLTKEKIKIDFLSRAIIYDEKVNNPKVFSKQRSRWLQAQYHFLMLYWLSGFKGLITKGNFDHFYKVMTLALPPKLLLPFALVSFGVFSFYLGEAKFIYTSFAILFLVNMITYYLAIPSKYFRAKNLRNWLSLFSMTFQTIRALFNMNKAKKEFIHTPHKT